MKIYFYFLRLLLAFVCKLSSQGKMLSLDRNLNTSASLDLALWCKCNLINYCKKYEPSKGYAQDNKYIISGTSCGILLCWQLSCVCYAGHLLFLPEECIQHCYGDCSHAPTQKPFCRCILTQTAWVSDWPKPQDRRQSPQLYACSL